MKTAWVPVTVGLGSNLGDREASLAAAVRRLAGHPGNRLCAVSSLYETEPFGKTDQPWFLNCVLQLETVLELAPFFRGLQEVEACFRHHRTGRWGPRELDLDLLFFGELVCSSPDLVLPHPGIPDRRFVLEPLCEIAPELRHPSLRLTARELLARLSDPSKVVRFSRPARSLEP